MTTDIPLILVIVLLMVTMWAVFFFTSMYLIRVLFQKLEHRDKSKER